MKYIYPRSTKAKALRPTPSAAAGLALPPWLYLLKRYMCIHTQERLPRAITNYRAQQWGSTSDLNKVDGGHKITITFSDYIWEFDITYIARSTIYTHKMMLYICGYTVEQNGLIFYLPQTTAIIQKCTRRRRT